MGNVSYIFGNGMDMQLGLPTRYIDFFDWVHTNYDDTENIFIPIDNELIEKRSEWADFENIIAGIISDFIKITENNALIDEFRKTKNKDYESTYNRFKEKNIGVIEFINIDFDDFIDLFQNYIEIINNYVSKKEIYKDTIKEINSDLKKINTLLATREKIIKEIHKNIIRSTGYEKKINYFTLNYTNIVSHLFNDIPSYPELTSWNNMVRFKKGICSYLHGFLPREGNEDGIVIGTHSVNDFDEEIRNMIKPDDFCKFEYISDAFQKEPYIHLVNNLDDNHCIICYGLHLGNSDKKLKEILFDNLVQNENNILIYYSFNHIIGGRIPKKEQSIINKTKKDLFNDFSEEIKNKVEKRVYVIPIRESHNLIKNKNRILSEEDCDIIKNTKPLEQI